MRVLMFGWEFPPFNSGGLGTACYGLTKGLSRQGVEITFVLPRLEDSEGEDYMRVLYAKNRKIKFRSVFSTLKPYITSETYNKEFSTPDSSGACATGNYDLDKKEFSTPDFKGAATPKVSKDGFSLLGSKGNIYGSDLFKEVYRYSQEAKDIAREEEFDVIHCHDWMTYPAGIEARKAAREKGMTVPLIAHVHATEFDRTAGNPSEYVYYLEKEGMNEADYIISVSNYTKDLIVRHYGINPEKIHVVHNSIDTCPGQECFAEEDFEIKKHHKIVLFLGRMTLQKGPDHFLWVAKKISEVDSDVRFVMAGGGDMFKRVVEESANLGIGDKVLFTDFVSGDDVDRAYRMADIYVMSSISEPFGLTVLEAMKNSTPVLVSKQSGVSEVVKNCLVADFWDVDEMANKILAVLNYPELKEGLAREGLSEIRNFSWDDPAKKCMNIYEEALMNVPHKKMVAQENFAKQNFVP